jgi:hypothetical protein
MFEKAIVARLAAVSGVTALVAARIYGNAAPSKPTLPYVTYFRVSTNEAPSANLDGTPAKIAWARLQFDAFAKTYKAVKELDDALRQALAGWSGQLAGQTIHEIRRLDSRDIYESETQPRLHRVQADYLVCFNL